MAKSPFERVFSKVDRKRILQRAIKEKTKIFIKNSKNVMYPFHALMVDGDLNVYGTLDETTLEPREFEKVTALFYLDRERYFITTRFKKLEGYWTLLSDQEFYRLNRRTAFRIQIPEKYDLSFHVSAIRNIEINKKFRIFEISSAGARIFWDSNKRLAVSSVLKGSLQWGRGKILPIEASVVHQLNDGIFGVRFVHMSPNTANRLKILCLETQLDLNSPKKTPL
jgi:hypothetical protein